GRRAAAKRGQLCRRFAPLCGRLAPRRSVDEPLRRGRARVASRREEMAAGRRARPWLAGQMGRMASPCRGAGAAASIGRRRQAVRIKSIYIAGFGVWRDCRIELTQPVTLLYGHNEAGKSTLMAFIRYV